jgi:hypothetical protein
MEEAIFVSDGIRRRTLPFNYKRLLLTSISYLNLK